MAKIPTKSLIAMAGAAALKAREYARQHPDQVANALDRVEATVSSRTHGRYDTKVGKGSSALRKSLGLPAAPPRPAASSTPSPPPPPPSIPDPGSTPDVPPSGPDQPAPTPDAPNPTPGTGDDPQPRTTPDEDRPLIPGEQTTR